MKKVRECFVFYVRNNIENKKNKLKAYNVILSMRFKKSVMKDYFVF